MATFPSCIATWSSKCARPHILRLIRIQSTQCQQWPSALCVTRRSFRFMLSCVVRASKKERVCYKLTLTGQGMTNCQFNLGWKRPDPSELNLFSLDIKRDPKSQAWWKSPQPQSARASCCTSLQPCSDTWLSSTTSNRSCWWRTVTRILLTRWLWSSEYVFW